MSLVENGESTYQLYFFPEVGCYFEEGEFLNTTMNVMDAFKRDAMTHRTTAKMRRNGTWSEVEFRKDGHPSNYREPGITVLSIQDCSHWCLPGVPDTWDELLYAHLLSREYRA
ncbi:hypothetical protein IFM89_014592 [Coptis chinensis]|uniref:Trichome birefringence-like C-terminal domain-containing protein n=1 Tax=Coptis chinensis TaxID=261450 RepID=A0A835LIL2_9MAGN|nr:hypothetical protein IFM89_014592 [Coptis chinensis]